LGYGSPHLGARGTSEQRAAQHTLWTSPTPLRSRLGVMSFPFGVRRVTSSLSRRLSLVPRLISPRPPSLLTGRPDGCFHPLLHRRWLRQSDCSLSRLLSYLLNGQITR
jgi:hypothetical protein